MKTNGRDLCFNYIVGSRGNQKIWTSFKKTMQILSEAKQEEDDLTDMLTEVFIKAREDGSAIFEYQGKNYILQSYEHIMILYEYPCPVEPLKVLKMFVPEEYDYHDWLHMRNKSYP